MKQHPLSPTPRTRRGARGRRGALAVIAAVATIVSTVPGSLSHTTAAWNDAEWTHAPEVGTSTFDCGTDNNYRTTSAGEFLSGSLLGIDLDDVVGLEGMRTAREAGQPSLVQPSTATNLGSADPRVSTFANPLAVSVLDDLIGLDLTGLNVGLPAGSTGAVNQYSQTSTLGTAAGAAGLVTNSGGVGVTAGTPDDQLPEPANLRLARALPVITNVSDVSLELGAVGASSELDWCAARESEDWGDASVTGVTRDYGIAGLDLVVDSPLVGALVTTVNRTVTDLNAAVAALAGVNGGIANLVRAQVALNVGSLLGVAVAGDVTISGLDLTGAVQGLLSEPLTDGTITIDLSAGTVSVNLATLLGDDVTGLNNLAPNTELLLNNDVLNPLVGRVGALLDTWTTRVTGALTTALDAAAVNVGLNLTIGILGGINVATLGVTIIDASIASIRNNTATVGLNANVIGLTGVVDLALGLLGLPTINTILSGLLSALSSTLLPSIATLLSTNLFGLVTTLGSTLTIVVTPLLTAVSGVFNSLPSVLSVAVNVQPDQSNPLPGSTFQPGRPPFASAEYSVSALRIGLVDALAPVNGFLYLSLATASAGPSVVLR